MAELKPCPFCGNDDLEIVGEFIPALQYEYFRVLCACCGASSCGHLHKEIAIKRWNRRAEDGKMHD